MTVLDAAQEYLARGMSVIPCNGKVASVPWTPYQKKLADPWDLPAWFKNGANVGIVTGQLSNLTVVDIDNEEGECQWETLCPDDASPLVSTPRGGHHHYFSYCPQLSNSVGVVKGIDVRSEGGMVVAPPSYGTNGLPYSWERPLTDNLPPVPEQFIKVISEKKAGSSWVSDGQILEPGNRNETLFHILYKMALGGSQPAELRTIAAELGKKAGLEPREVETTLRSALERATRKDRALSKQVEDWVRETTGPFKLTDLRKELGLAAPEDRAQVNTIMQRLKMRMIVEATGRVAGEYRLLVKDCNEVKWIDAIEAPLDILYPFGIEKLCSTYSKNIVVVSGKSNAGKTAFFLDFVKKNMGQHEIHYFSSEMGESEARLRIFMHEDVDPHDWKFTMWDRNRDFADVIKPNAINIVDYLEALDGEEYKVKSYISQIWNKLDKGIALIALQKNKDRDIGRGGEATLDRARLYVAIDDGRIKLIKCKNWATEVNPNGLVRHFKLIRGWKFIPDTDWLSRDDQTMMEEMDKAKMSPEHKKRTFKLLKEEKN